MVAIFLFICHPQVEKDLSWMLISWESFRISNDEISLPDFENSPKGWLACQRRSAFHGKSHVTCKKKEKNVTSCIKTKCGSKYEVTKLEM